MNENTILWRLPFALLATSLVACEAEDQRQTIVGQLESGIEALDQKLAEEPSETTIGHAEHSCNELLPAMLVVRAAADELEGLVADDLWPLATYQEMLFIK